MKSLQKKDIFFRKKFFNYEKYCAILKFLKFFLLLKKKQNFYLIFLYKFYNNNFINFSNKTKIKSRCIVSNRGRGIFKKYSLSRIKFREYIQAGFLPGYKKSVW